MCWQYQYVFLFSITLFKLKLFISAWPETKWIPIYTSLDNAQNIWEWFAHSDNLAILFKQILLPQIPTEQLLYPFVDCSGHIADLQLPPHGPPTTRRVCLPTQKHRQLLASWRLESGLCLRLHSTAPHLCFSWHWST
jgi:hypothetical protein